VQEYSRGGKMKRFPPFFRHRGSLLLAPGKWGVHEVRGGGKHSTGGETTRGQKAPHEGRKRG